MFQWVTREPQCALVTNFFYGLEHLLVILIFYTNLFGIFRFDGTKPSIVGRDRR